MEAPQARVIPPLDDLNYRAQQFIETDSKMSTVLLALDGQHRLVVLKIARIDRVARAEVNRQAIQNTVTWLTRLGKHYSLLDLYPIDRKTLNWWSRRFATPVYRATLSQWPGQPDFLVMEYLPGGALSDFVGERPLDLAQALWVAHQIATVLAYLHDHGCVHRDLKPENILFRETPLRSEPTRPIMPVLIDFGVAAQIGETRLVAGTRLWMTPELQEAYERYPLPVDPTWDTYALGLILCYMLTGQRPLRRNSDTGGYERFYQQTLAQVERLLLQTELLSAQAANRLRQLLQQTLARDVNQRPTAHSFANETNALLAELGNPFAHASAGIPSRSSDSPRRPLAQNWTMVGGMLGLVLCLLVIGLLFWRYGMAVNGAPTVNQPPVVLQPTDTNAVAPTLGIPTKSKVQVTLAPEPPAIPTLVTNSVSTSTPDKPPTLAIASPTVLAVAPTLAIPTPLPTPIAPTSTEVAAPTVAEIAVIVTPTLTNTPVATATSLPTSTPMPVATRQLTVTRAVPPTAQPIGHVRLLKPAPDASGDTVKIDFAWQPVDPPVSADQCFELVFWAPDRTADKRSPVGAGKALQGRVDFAVLAASGDPVLGQLARSRQPFYWGVRVVTCETPNKILRDVEEVRAYTFTGAL